VPAGRCICCEGIGLFASVSAVDTLPGPRFAKMSFSSGLAPAALINVLVGLAQAYVPSSRLFLLSLRSKLLSPPNSTRRCGQVGLAPAKC